MAKECGSFTISGTGNSTVLFNNAGLTAELIEFELGPRASTDETHVIRSNGWTDGTRKRCISIYSDGSSLITRESNSYPMRHYKNVSGTITLMIRFTVTDMATAGEFSINVDTYAGSSFTCSFKAS